MATAAQLQRVRDGLRRAGNPNWETLSDADAIKEYLRVSDPSDPFRAELQGGAPGAPEPGSRLDQGYKAAKAFDVWGNKFKTDNGRWPTDEEITAAWGTYGMAVVNYIRSSGIAPSTYSPEQKEQFFKDVAQVALQVEPAGTVGTAYAEVPGIEQRKFDWQKDYDEKKFAADEAFRKAQQALAQGSYELAQEQFSYMKVRDAESQAIQLAGLTGVYQGNPTLALQQFDFNKQAFEKDYGLRYDQFAFEQRKFGETMEFEKDKFAQTIGWDKERFAQEFGLDVEKFEAGKEQWAAEQGLREADVTGFYKNAPTLKREELALGQARYGNVLGSIALSRGQPVQNYRGMPPGFAGGAGGAAGAAGMGPVAGMTGEEAAGQLPPEMPENIRAITTGRPLPAYGLSTGAGSPVALRAAGAQAQANERPLERAARAEAYELSGKRWEDQEWEEEKIRRNLGQGLPTASYR